MTLGGVRLAVGSVHRIGQGNNGHGTQVAALFSSAVRFGPDDRDPALTASLRRRTGSASSSKCTAAGPPTSVSRSRRSRVLFRKDTAWFAAGDERMFTPSSIHGCGLASPSFATCRPCCWSPLGSGR